VSDRPLVAGFYDRGVRLRIEYIGHATTLIALDGVRLLTDPLLRRRVAHLRRTVRVDAAALRGVDAVLLSHGHNDHLDPPSLARLGRSVLIVAPRGLGGFLRKRRFEHVVELDEGEQLSVGSVVVRATHAEHDGSRPFTRVRASALGFAVEGSRRVYFAGDTELFPEMDGLVSDLDVALVPIWGWGPTLGRGKHLSPAEAAEALRLLRPRIAIPIHWGTYRPAHLGLRVLPDFLTDPAARFVEAAAVAAPDVEIHVLRPGETFQL
jgi:L-ascorbate metabolism protein UlaG (beta-lactamase superfamily)